MNQKFEQLDMSMKSLYLKLEMYRKSDFRYQEILTALAQQYQTYTTLIESLYDKYKDKNVIVYVPKYSDIDSIKKLLTSAGYLEEQISKSKH